ncbi:MAG: recombinase family protein [Albidovulum sp.]|nr:recombinase family protein [Albidovulum sp.]
MDEIRKDDVLIVSELSRLGRSMLECMEILSIASDAGFQVHAIKGSWRLDETIESRLDRYCPEIEAVLADGSTQKLIAKHKNATPANLSNWMKKIGIRKPELLILRRNRCQCALRTSYVLFMGNRRRISG